MDQYAGGAQPRESGDAQQGTQGDKLGEAMRNAGRSGGQSSGGTTDRQETPASQATTSDPFMVVRQMVEDIDRVFDDFGFPRMSFDISPMSILDSARGRSPGGMMNREAMWAPRVDVVRRDNAMIVRADLPGLKKEDIQLEVENGMLTLSGERRDERQSNQEGYFRSERRYGRFMRTIALPEGVDADAFEATFTDGVLEVRIPMPEGQNRQAQKVEIR